MNKNKILNTAKKVIRTEIDGLEMLEDSLGEDFLKLVDTIANSNGNLILSGMGKSGHIARKIASTLSSTGIKSFFVHPGEASHGDLGMISKNDVVILLSNSGETRELTDLINYTKRFNITLACFVSNENSSLASYSDIVIKIPSASEAVSFNAPTTSTTMMVALGDALAVTLLELKGFSRDDFKIFHPGGRLGANFKLVSDLMHKKSEIPINFESDSLAVLVDEMTNKKFGCSTIINKSGVVVGIITDGDLRRALKGDIYNMSVGDIMTRDPKMILSKSLAVEAIDIMNKNKITTLLIVDKHMKPEGIIHMHDCLMSGVSPK